MCVCVSIGTRDMRFGSLLSGFTPKCLQQLGLGQLGVKSQELHLNFPKGIQAIICQDVS